MKSPRQYIIEKKELDSSKFVPLTPRSKYQYGDWVVVGDIDGIFKKRQTIVVDL